MLEKVFLDNLNEDNVVVVKVITTEEGYTFTERVGYDNSVTGRQELERDVLNPYKSVIFMMWGDSPTINEKDI